MDDERLAELMVKVVDGLATDAEQRELEAYVEVHPELADELAAHEALRGVTEAWVGRLEVDAIEDAWTQASTTRLAGAVGLVLVVGGSGLFVGFGAWELWLDPTAPWWVKAGSTMVFVGLSLMLLSVVRWKWKTSGSDRYSEVVR